VVAVLVSRYPRVDTPTWKRGLASDLLEAGFDLHVVYSRSSLAAQVQAGLAEFGAAGAARRFAEGRLPSRRAPAGGPAPAQSLAVWAEQRGAPVHRFARLGDDDCLARLSELAPDLLVLAGADLVPRSVLAIPRVATVNGHYGLLPAYRGMNVTEWSIYHDDPVGVSVHVVDPGIDTGDILLRRAIPVPTGASLESLRAKHQETARALLAEAAVGLRDGGLAPTPQSPEDGRQFYRMHPVLRERAEAKLRDGTYAWLDRDVTGITP